MHACIHSSQPEANFLISERVCLLRAVGHRGVSPDGGSAARDDDVDFTRCFACSSRMLHPKGEKYVAGHCYVPYVYTTP
jgi:hypothetical protein